MDRQARRTPARLLTSAVVLVLVALAVAGLVRSAGVGGPATAEERAHEVAASLRCPTCQGLSVADSNSPLAQSMRQIIDEQIAAGESEASVQQYFVDRYGDWVLLSPRAEGAGWVVWGIPAAAVLVGLLVAAQLVRRTQTSQSLRWLAVGGALAVALGVLVTVNLDERGEGELATGNLPAAGTGAGAPPAGTSGDPASGEAGRLELLRAAVEQDPEDIGMRLALASTAFEAGQLDAVRTQADAVLEREPENVDALMLRGLAARSRGDEQATAALRRFLELAPSEHPAVPLVRGLLEGGR